MELYALLALPLQLPSIPRAVVLLSSEFAQPQPELRKLVQLISTDPVLASQVLREANAPAFGLAGQVYGVAEALALLDMAQVRATVMAHPPGGARHSVPGIDMQQFWRYSVNVARLARSLAGVLHQNPHAAYTAGLLHAIGEVAMLAGMPQRMLRIHDIAPPFDALRARAEQKIYGYCYAHVSAALVRQWKLPDTIADALEYQHVPFRRKVYEPLAGIVHLAAWRVRGRENGLTERELTVAFPDEVGLALGLDIDVVLQQDPIDWTHSDSGRSRT